MIKVEHLQKYFNRRQKNEIHVLNDISLEFPEKGLVVLLGASGSGKTTLLNVLGGLDKASSGSVEVCGVKLDQSSTKAITKLRNKYLGFVYQFHHLLPEFSATENVAMPLYISGLKRRDAEKKALQLLDLVGYHTELSINHLSFRVVKGKESPSQER